MRIAILGTRGIPANYGGFETFAEELATRLAANGHEVTVYCRRGIVQGDQPKYRGVNLVHLPAVRNKHAETISHTLLSAIHALFRRYDIVYVCNSANAPICFIPLLRGQRVVLNVDGLEWRRGKWGRIAREYYRFAAKLAARMPIQVVTDADVIRQYYRRRLRRETRCFAYGTELYDRGSFVERLALLGLTADRYILYVSRLERENNALLVIQAYRDLVTDIPLVILGDAPYARGYIEELHRAADSRVLFLGARYGDDYHALQSNALLYVQATEVGGTHPALVEAMGHRNAIIAHDVPEHREVLGEAGWYFGFHDVSDLTHQLRFLLDSPGEIEGGRARATRRVQERYGWDAVARDYERYFDELLGRRPGSWQAS